MRRLRAQMERELPAGQAGIHMPAMRGGGEDEMTDEELDELLAMIRSEAAKIDARRERERKHLLEVDLIQINKTRDARLLREEIHNRRWRRR